MQIIKININKELTNLIQKIDLECSARRDIIQFLLSSSDFEIQQEKFDKYQEDYDKKYYEFSLLKQNLENEYVLPQVKNSKNFHWQLNYADSVLIINIEDSILNE